MKRRWLAPLTMLIVLVVTASCAPKTELSAPELAELLGIKRWIVPMPKDARYEWTFEIRDYKSPAPVPIKTNGWADPKKRAEVTFMPIGAGTVYRFWLTQGAGTSSGETRIDVCDNPDDTSVKCDAGQFETTWYQPPRQTADGRSYVLCELQDTFEPRRHKQLVLYLTKFRLEDMNEDAK